MIFMQPVFDAIFNQLEFFGFVIAWCDIPIKIVHRKNINNGIVRYKTYFLGIEGTKKSRWQIFVECSGFANGEHQLGHHG